MPLHRAAVQLVQHLKAERLETLQTELRSSITALHQLVQISSTPTSPKPVTGWTAATSKMPDSNAGHKEWAKHDAHKVNKQAAAKRQERTKEAVEQAKKAAEEVKASEARLEKNIKDTYGFISDIK